VTGVQLTRKHGNITDCKKAYFDQIHKTLKSNNIPQEGHQEG